MKSRLVCQVSTFLALVVLNPSLSNAEMDPSAACKALEKGEASFTAIYDRYKDDFAKEYPVESKYADRAQGLALLRDEAKLDPKALAAAILIQQMSLGATNSSDRGYEKELQDLQAEVLTSRRCLDQDREIFHLREVNKLSLECQSSGRVRDAIGNVRRAINDKFLQINRAIAGSMPGLTWDGDSFRYLAKSGELVMVPAINWEGGFDRLEISSTTRFSAQNSHRLFTFSSKFDLKQGVPQHEFEVFGTYDSFDVFLTNNFHFPAGFKADRCPGRR